MRPWIRCWKSKISKEKHQVIKARKKQKGLVKNIINHPDDHKAQDAYEANVHIEQTENKNAKTHKDRLKTLISNKTIE